MRTCEFPGCIREVAPPQRKYCGQPHEAPGRRQRIKFTLRWDKLLQPQFTTIRSYRAEKETFYRAHVGETFNLILVRNEWSVRGPKIGEATLTGVLRCIPAELPAAVIAADVRLEGRIEHGWFNRVSAMRDGLLLQFENHTGLLGGG